MKTATKFRISENINPNFFSLHLLAFVMVAVLLSNLAAACPLCVESTPYKHGLQWAVLFLLPVPFVLAGTLIWWVRRHLPLDSE